MVKDILKLDSLKEISLIGGSKGLEKNIEWIYVAECFEDPLEGIKWLQGGEIVFITGVGMKGDLTSLTKLITGIREKDGVGLIVNVGMYINNIPIEAIEISNKLEIPLFTLPWEVKLVDVSQEISNAIILARIEENSMNHLLNNILFRGGELEDNVIEKATYFGYNIEGRCYICTINIDGFENYIKINNLNDEMSISRVKLTFIKIVRDILDKYSLKIPIIDNEDSVIVFNRGEENYMIRLEKAIKEIQEVIIKRIPRLSVSAGIGNSYSDLKMMKQSLNEAQLVIKSIKCQNLNNTIKKYKDIGFYGLLFSIENKDVLKNYYLDVLEPIIQNDNKKKDINSTEILETYLNENCNITSTSEKLFMHRNSLKYRLKKIEDLLGYDLHKFEDCMKVKTALYIKKILK